jgi:hypothetical protein
LNTRRNALERIYKIAQYEIVFIPYYICDAILEPFNKLKINYEFYFIDEKFEPLFNFNKLKGNEGFLYTNYFGLKNSFVSTLSQYCKNLIIDNSQAFYSLPKPGLPTFYSCRKFFGVPDGAYLYLFGVTEIDFPLDYSSERFKHLLTRIEFGPEDGYDDYKSNDKSLIGQPIKLMSILTQALLCNIDYDKVAKARRENFLFFHEHLKKSNELKLPENEDFVPMVFPYLTANGKSLKQRLMRDGVFIATYWPNVINNTKKENYEYYLAEQNVCLPIDQRYGIKEMNNILKIITWKQKYF